MASIGKNPRWLDLGWNRARKRENSRREKRVQRGKGAVGYKEGGVMWSLAAIVWTLAFTLRNVGRHWRILRRRLTESNLMF